MEAVPGHLLAGSLAMKSLALIALFSAFIAAQPGPAQAPPGQVPFGHEDVVPGVAPRGPSPGQTQEKLLSFDPLEVELRWVGGRWQLFTKGALLKDFGAQRNEAWEALRLIRSLQLTQQGSIGSPHPIMEYWLADGRAPQGLGFGLRLLSIDQATLRVESIQGQWCVRDTSRILFNFGGQQAEAQQALDVLHKYGFTQVGYVGWPTPLMIYFLGDGNGLGIPAAIPMPSLQKNPLAKAGPTPAQPANLAPFAVHQLTPPSVGQGNSSFHFDPSRVEIKNVGDCWQLVYGQHLLARLRTREDARRALGIIQSFRFTEMCLIGSPEPRFSYFLVHGQAPRGLRITIPSQALKLEALAVQQVGPDWMLVDGQQPLVNFGTHQEDAQQLLQVIGRYHFDHLCRIGTPGPLSMTFLVIGH
jgi:hypothetical protein